MQTNFRKTIPYIFRNEPSHTFFDKSFEDANDELYLNLNELNAAFLEDNQTRLSYNYEHKLDPRTKQKVKQMEYNHTKELPPHLFDCGLLRSKVSKTNHVRGVRHLHALNSCQELSEADFLDYRQILTTIKEENIETAKFIKEHASIWHDKLYEPAKPLVALYAQWFQRKIHKLMQLPHMHTAYNTHSGLPHLRQCTSFEVQQACIADVQLLSRKGWLHVWPHNAQQTDWTTMFVKLQQYINDYQTAQQDVERFQRSEFKLEMQLETAQMKQHKYFMPFETLLFLLTAGDYVDLPTEVFLEIQSNAQNDFKFIKFDAPMPARNCGWHTNKQMVEQAYAAYKTRHATYLQVAGDRVIGMSSGVNCTQEIMANVAAGKHKYECLKLEDLLAKHGPQLKTASDECVKTNVALLRWQLQNAHTSEHFQIYTTLELPPVLSESGEEYLGCHAIKLEYKPQFGCEQMTKYELLREWLKLSLLADCSGATHGKCQRISIANYQTQVLEHLSLPRLQQLLQDIYQINVHMLLSQLGEFLKLLTTMPSSNSKYLLRYTAKYAEKLLFCAPSTEITQNTISMRELYADVIPTDLQFMIQEEERVYLPIMPDLCSLVHLWHKILPCTFLPLVGQQKRCKKTEALFRNSNLTASAEHRQLIERTQQKSQEKLAKLKEISKQKKKNSGSSKKRKFLRDAKWRMKEQEERDKAEQKRTTPQQQEDLTFDSDGQRRKKQQQEDLAFDLDLGF